jgi:hypothetical protein
MTNHPARRRYAICLRNDGADDLDVRKVYEVIPDETSSRHGLLRVVDESGEDYLYPAEFFAAVEVPEEVEQALSSGRVASGVDRR